jgi:two-component system sensor histidine kinase/response regulator
MENVESILNVDDYGPGRYARTRVLRQAGFTVWEAATGKETLRLVAEHRPPIVLLDVNLPDMRGFEVCRRIRENPDTVATTILHISASNVQAEHQVEGLEGGADSYLVEPVDPKVLIATIRAFFRAREAEAALRRSNEELEWFGRRVAHDLSEPLRTVIAHTQLLERRLGPKLDAMHSESLHLVVDAATRMQSFIDGLLSYAQAVDAGGPIETVDCEALLERITANLHAAIEASGAAITHDPLPAVTADPGIEEIFQNLISNAVKYRREDVRPEINISVRPQGDFWEFSVRDNGIGIEERYQDNIFKIFRRLHGRDVAGNGIGLALCKRIVENQGGRIWFESKPGVGSTFFFTLRKARNPIQSGS